VTANLGPGDWRLEPTVCVGLLALVAVYITLWRRGRLRGDDDVSPWFATAAWRPVVFATGVVTGFIALQSPIDVGGDDYLVSLHMLQHLLLMMVAPPLVLLGICGVGSTGGDRHRRWRALGTWITRPWQATVIFNVVLLVWHLPVLYDATLTTQPIHIAEHLTFIAAGVVFWWPIVDPLRRQSPRPVTPFQKIAMLVVAGVPPTVLGFVLAMGRSAFYDFYARAPRLWGVSAVTDQQVAGTTMLGLGNVIYFAAISIIFLRLFGNPAEDETIAEEESVTAQTASSEPNALV
jgi:putative membrane protein